MISHISIVRSNLGDRIGADFRMTWLDADRIVDLVHLQSILDYMTYYNLDSYTVADAMNIPGTPTHVTFHDEQCHIVDQGWRIAAAQYIARYLISHPKYYDAEKGESDDTKHPDC